MASAIDLPARAPVGEDAREVPRSEVPRSEVPRFSAEALSFFLDERQVLFDVSLDVPARGVTALIGPSGCGKSAFLRCLNRMNETQEGARTTGSLRLDGDDLYAPSVDVAALRRRVGMVFRSAQVFPRSVFENVAYGLRVGGVARRADLDARVERALARAGLWDELRDALHAPARALPPGQQQRLCVARALALDPEVLLLDEPASALDPVAAARLEETLSALRDELTVVVVTHAMQQAARVSQTTAFFHQGRLVEVGDTRDVFTRPREAATQDYITGRFG